MKRARTESDLPIEEQYPKLVRDRIPEIIERNGKRAVTHIAEPGEYVRFLLAKLVEEATELQEAQDYDHQKEEVADVREVLKALQVVLKIPEREIVEVQNSKHEERGGFEDRIILDSLPK